ncbi:MAG: hypothetical protein HY679_05225 [Chloroflexi bacterium]|nr:hypothetical protein [Chloroflexota bacterium]
MPQAISAVKLSQTPTPTQTLAATLIPPVTQTATPSAAPLEPPDATGTPASATTATAAVPGGMLPTPGAVATTATAAGVATSTPTTTATATSAAQSTATATASSTATSTETSTGAPTPTATATVMGNLTGWTFTSLRVQPDAVANSLTVFGDAVNNSSSTQTINRIYGTFYDESGNVIADESRTSDGYPMDIAPPGGRVPFSLLVLGIRSAASYTLTIENGEAQPTPRQDFDIYNVTQYFDGDDYCLSGTVRNPGAELSEYLYIVAVLFDAQNAVINMSDGYDADLPDVAGGKALDFEACAGPLGQSVARYELRAWGH